MRFIKVKQRYLCTFLENIVDQCVSMVLHCLADIAREEVTRMKRPSKIRLPNPLNSLSLVVVVVVYPIGKNFSKLCQKGSKLTNYHFGQSLLWPFSLFYRVVRPSVRPSGHRRGHHGYVSGLRRQQQQQCRRVRTTIWSLLTSTLNDLTYLSTYTTFFILLLSGCSRVWEIGHIPPGKTEERGC